MEKYSHGKRFKNAKMSKVGSYTAKELKNRDRPSKIAVKTHNKLNPNPSKKRYYETKSFMVGFIGIFFVCILFLILFARLRSNGEYSLTFTGFLNYLSKSPKLNFAPLSSFEIVGDWGLFDFLKNFFNLFAKMIGVISWLGELIINCFEWVWFFVRFILFGS